MKLIIFLSFVLCIAETGFIHSKGIEQIIVSLHAQVKKVVSELTQYKNYFHQKAQQQLTNEEQNNMQEINSIVNSALESILTDVLEVKGEVKDAFLCYETAAQELDSSSKSGYRELDRCSVAASFIIDRYLNITNCTIKAGNNLKNSLIMIHLDCMSSDYWQQQYCISTKLLQAATSVNLLKKASEQLQNNEYSWLNQVIAQARPCYSQARNKVFNDSLKIIRAASICIINLQNTKL